MTGTTDTETETETETCDVCGRETENYRTIEYDDTDIGEQIECTGENSCAHGIRWRNNKREKGEFDLKQEISDA